MPYHPFRPPASAVYVGPVLRSKKVPNPSPAGGLPMGALPVGWQYGAKATEGKAWIPRVRHGMWKRDSPAEWRKPRRRLNMNNADGAQNPALAAKIAAARAGRDPEKERQQRLYGWGVTAPTGAAQRRRGARPQQSQPPPPQQQQQPAPQQSAKPHQKTKPRREAQGPTVVTRRAATKAKGAYEAKAAKATAAPPCDGRSHPEDDLHC